MAGNLASTWCKLHLRRRTALQKWVVNEANLASQDSGSGKNQELHESIVNGLHEL